MGRKHKRVIIPKNRDIEELVEQDYRKTRIENSKIINTQRVNKPNVNEQSEKEQRVNEQSVNEQSVNEQKANEQRDNAQKVNTQTINKEQDFRNRIKQDISLPNKKIQNTFERKDAEIAEQKRKEEYLRAIRKLEEQQEER